MATLTNIACNAFNIIRSKDDFNTGFSKALKSTGTLSEAARSRLVSRFNLTLRNSDSDAARRLLASAQQNVDTMKACGARDSLQTIVNHCGLVTWLAEQSSGGSVATHHLDASLAATRARYIQKDMTLAEAFACKLQNRDISFRTRERLLSMFVAKVQHPDFSGQRAAFKLELAAIRSAISSMEACPAKDDLLRLAESFIVGVSDPATVHAANDEFSSPTIPFDDGLSLSSYSPLSSHYGTTRSRDDDSDSILTTSTEGSASVDDTSMTLLEVFTMMSAATSITEEWMETIDDVFKERCQIFDFYDDPHVAPRSSSFGNPKVPGFVNLSKAPDEIELIKSVVEWMPENSARTALMEKAEHWSATIEKATVWWESQVDTLALQQELAEPEQLLLDSAHCWLGLPPDEVKQYIQEKRPAVMTFGGVGDSTV